MQSGDSITVKEVRTTEELRQARGIRELVLETEQGFPREVNVDGLDESAYHVLMLDGDEPVGTGRLVVTGPAEGMIARIAMLPSHRGRGLGGRLIRQLENIAHRRGLHTIRLEPHARLEGFFRRLGYERVSGPFLQGRHSLIRITRRL